MRVPKKQFINDGFQVSEVKREDCMKNRVVSLIVLAVFALFMSSVAFAQEEAGGPPARGGADRGPKVHAGPWNGDPSDLTGTWRLGGGGGGGGAQQAPKLSSWSGDVDPVLTAEGKKIMATHQPSEGPRANKEPAEDNDPELVGNPQGTIRSLGYGQYGHEIFNLPDSVFHVFEWFHQFRRIWTDGRPMPDANIYGPYWYGYSLGTRTKTGLDVHSALYDGRAWLDAWGTPMSDQMQTDEHWVRLSQDSMQLTVTFNDPVIFTKPWTSKTIKYVPHECAIGSCKDGGSITEAILGPIDENAFTHNIRVAGADGNHKNGNNSIDDLRKAGAR
jgi:hypothetical protein